MVVGLEEIMLSDWQSPHPNWWIRTKGLTNWIAEKVWVEGTAYRWEVYLPGRGESIEEESPSGMGAGTSLEGAKRDADRFWSLSG